MFIAPMFIIHDFGTQDNINQVLVTGMTYYVDNMQGSYCFNLQWLNFKRSRCNLDNLGENLGTFWAKKVSWASWFFLGLYGFGLFCNCLGGFAAYWMFRGYVYGLSNAVCFVAALCYSLGLA